MAMDMQLQSLEGAVMSGNNTQLFLISLRGLRDSLASAVSQIDVLLNLAERPVTEPESTECSHPAGARVPIPAMGHATRFFCNKCRQEVEG